MRQFLGTPSAADDMPALLAWWKDEAQRSTAAAQHGKHGHPASTPAKAGAGTGAGDVDVDGDSTPAATPARQLRARGAAQTPAGKTPRPAGQHGKAAGAAHVQLQVPVLVLQDSDSVDAEALEELVVALHEVGQQRTF